MRWPLSDLDFGSPLQIKAKAKGIGGHHGHEGGHGSSGTSDVAGGQGTEYNTGSGHAGQGYNTGSSDVTATQGQGHGSGLSGHQGQAGYNTGRKLVCVPLVRDVKPFCLHVPHSWVVSNVYRQPDSHSGL